MSYFRLYLTRMVLVSFDDILVYSPIWQQHLSHLQIVVATLMRKRFSTNIKKCQFGQSSIEYLGHVISSEGVSMDPAKIQGVLAWPMAKNVKGLKGFLGLTGYYRKFIAGYGKIAKPLIN